MPALTQADYEQLAKWRQLLRHFLVFSEKRAARMGLTTQQHQAMLAVKGFGGNRALTIGELAEYLGIRHHSAVGLVDRLHAKGLVRRDTAPIDHRQVLVDLTPRAKKLLQRLSASHRDELGRLAPFLRILLAYFEPPATGSASAALPDSPHKVRQRCPTSAHRSLDMP